MLREILEKEPMNPLARRDGDACGLTPTYSFRSPRKGGQNAAGMEHLLVILSVAKDLARWAPRATQASPLFSTPLPPLRDQTSGPQFVAASS